MKEKITNLSLSDAKSKEVHFNVDELLLLGDEGICQYGVFLPVKFYGEIVEEEEHVIGHA
jgi:hypothetical protein